jgi:methionyl-tRNA formyltransferase
MRILYLGNNWVGWQVLKWLKEQGEEIVGLVVPAPNRQKYVEEMKQVAGLPANRIFDGSQLAKAEMQEAIQGLRPDLGLSLLFCYLFKPEFLRIFPQGVINLHPSFLPYNKGTYNNVWSIIDKTPAGVTLHYIDEGVDTGDIIAQEEVLIEPVDTGESLYRKLERASLELFRGMWPAIKAGKAPRHPQIKEAGTFHLTKDVEAIDEIELDRRYLARDLINLFRARTFPPYKGAYFMDQGRRVYLRLQLMYGEEE